MPSGFLLTGALNLFWVLILIASTQFLPTAYKYSISILRVNINLNVFLGQFGPMFIGVKRTWFLARPQKVHVFGPGTNKICFYHQKPKAYEIPLKPRNICFLVKSRKAYGIGRELKTVCFFPKSQKHMELTSELKSIWNWAGIQKHMFFH